MFVLKHIINIGLGIVNWWLNKNRFSMGKMLFSKFTNCFSNLAQNYGYASIILARETIK